MVPAAMTFVRRLLALLALAVIVLAATRQLDWRWSALLEQLRGASLPFLTLALAANLASVVTRAGLWWLFLRNAGAPRFSLALRGTTAGLALNGVLIGRAGEAARVLMVLKSSAIDGPAAVATVVAERVALIAGYVVIAIAGSRFVEFPDAVTRRLGFAVWAIVGFGALVGAGVVVATRVTTRTRHLVAVVNATPPAACTLLVVATWVLQLATYHLTALALRFPTPLSGSLAALVLVNAGSTVGITPGNTGVIQVAYAAAMRMSGLPVDAAVGVAVVLQAVQTLPVLVLWPALLMADWCRPRHPRQSSGGGERDGRRRGALAVAASILGRGRVESLRARMSFRSCWAPRTSSRPLTVTPRRGTRLTRRSALRDELSPPRPR